MTDARSLEGVLPPATFLVVVGAVLALAFHDVQRLEMAPEPVTGTAAAAVPLTSPQADDRPSSRAMLADWALFGSPDAPPAPSAPPTPAIVDEASLPEASASFQLFGVIEADDGSSARAILGVSDADQREYRVGDAAPDGARIHAVRARAVILERDGRLEQMRLPALAIGQPAAPAPRNFSPQRLPGAGMPAPQIYSGDSPPGAAPMLLPDIVTPPPDSAPPPMAEMPLESNPESQ